MLWRKVQYYMKYHGISCKQTFSESVLRTPVYSAEECQEIPLNINGEIMEDFVLFYFWRIDWSSWADVVLGEENTAMIPGDLLHFWLFKSQLSNCKILSAITKKTKKKLTSSTISLSSPSLQVDIMVGNYEEKQK